MTARLWRLSAVLLPLFAQLAPAGAADSLPTVEAIRDKVRAATGPRASSYRETDETVRSNGVTVVEHDVVRGDDYRYAFDTGRFHTERGRYQAEDWHMNDNGQVILDAPDPGKETPEPMTTAVTAITSPVAG